MKTTRPSVPFRAALVAIAALVLSASFARAADAPASSPAKPTPQLWSVAIADTIMQRHPDFTKPFWKPWTYVNGYMLYGLDLMYRATGDRKYFDYIQRYIDRFVDAKGNIAFKDDKGVAQDFAFDAVDDILTGTALITLYEHTKDERYKIAATRIRRAFDTYPRNPDGGFWHGASLKGEMWIDGVFMGQLFVIRYGQVIGDSAYCFDEATRQITIFAGHCRKGDSGLYLHAWAAQPKLAKVVGDFRPKQDTFWADPQTGLSSEVWSEGLGWYALLLAETLNALPPDHPRRAEVLDIYRRLAAGLKRTQDPKTGRWFQVVDKGDRPDNWTDNSGSAMFTYSIQKGLDLGLLDTKEYAPVVARGYQGIIGNAKINAQGLVDIYSACQGLCVQANYDAYINYPKAVNGNEAVAGFLWATTLVEKPALEKLKQR